MPITSECHFHSCKAVHPYSWNGEQTMDKWGLHLPMQRRGGGFKETWVTAVVLTPGGGLELEYEVLCAFVHRQALP